MLTIDQRLLPAATPQLYRIAYDLRGYQRKYGTILSTVRSLGDAVWALRSEAWVASQYSIIDVRSIIKASVRNGDGFVVSTLDADFIADGVLPEAQIWLTRYQKRAA